MEQEIWGKLETKVRRLVFDLLEPSVTRVAEHKETLELLRRTDESLSRKIDNLDLVAEKLSKRLSLVDDFSRKIVQFDANMKVQETTFAHDRESVKDQLEVFLKQLTNCDENIAILQGQTQSLKTDLVNLVFDTNNSKQNLSNRMEMMREEFFEKIKELNEQTEELNSFYVMIDKKFSNHMNDFEEVDVIAKKAEHYAEDNMNQLKMIFKNFNTFKKESKDQLEKVRQMATQFSQTLTDSIRAVREKLKAEVPISTQLMISENLHMVLDLKSKKALAEYEKGKYAEWELNTVPSVLEDYIFAAQKRTQETIEIPLPKAEIIKQDHQPENFEEIKVETIKRRQTVKFSKENTVKELPKLETEAKDTQDHIPDDETVEKQEIDEDFENSEDQSLSSPSNHSLDLENLQKNSEAIAKMMNIKDFTEDIELLHDTIRKFKEETKDQLKRLQNTDSALEEKSQNMIKKIYENSTKLEEQKNIIQTLTEKTEKDKQEANFHTLKVQETLENQIFTIKTAFEALYAEFQVLSKKVNSDMSVLFENFSVFTQNTNEFIQTQDKKLLEFYDNIMKQSQILDLKIEQAALECNSAVTQRKRDHCDNQAEFKKIFGIFDLLDKRNEQISKNVENMNRSFQLLAEFSRISQALQYQDELDRESIALFGVKQSKHSSNRSFSMSKASITIDKQCISCSGQPNFVTSAFKMACLAYSPTSVLFKDTVYERSELIDIQKRIVDGIYDETLADFSGLYENNKQSHSMKLNQWRPVSRASHLSISNQLVSATPDLPPLSFPKRNF